MGERWEQIRDGLILAANSIDANVSSYRHLFWDACKLVAQLEAELELVAGSISAYIDKRDNAPASADSHMQEVEYILQKYLPGDNGYSEGAKLLRREVWKAIDRYYKDEDD